MSNSEQDDVALEKAPTQDQDEINSFDAPRTLGERLLPALVIALESCLLYALLLGLAGFHFLGASEPLLPIWLLFSVPLALYWSVQYLQRAKFQRFRVLREQMPRMLVILLACLSLWLFLYIQVAPIFSPAWIQSLVSDALQFDARFYQVVALFVLVCYLGWRGIQLAHNGVEAQTITRLGRLGLGCFLLVILCYQLQLNLHLTPPQPLALFLLIPVFLFLLILSRALHQVSYLRRFHAIGLQGSARYQERLILQVVAVLGAIGACLMFLVGSTTLSGNFTSLLSPVGAVYDWLASALAQIVLAVWTPIAAFLLWLLNLFPTPIKQRLSAPDSKDLACPKKLPSDLKVPLKCLPQKPNPHFDPYLLILIIKIALPILLISIVIYLLWRKYRQVVAARAMERTNQGKGDVHESLWSWSLFLAQCKALLLAVLTRLHLLRKHTTAAGQDAPDDIQMATPAARSIREVYRALLQKAAHRGYARTKDETPYEFRRRLHSREPLVEPELEAITEAYALIRYGGSVPDHTEVGRIRQTWRELDHKWITPS